MAAKSEKVEKADPVLSTESVSSETFPEGTHPARPPAETHHSVERYVYKDNPDKPDPSTVAQVVEIKEV